MLFLLRNVRNVRKVRESVMENGTAARGRARKCSTGCKRPAQPGKDLCGPCEVQFNRIYKDQDQGKKDDMAKKTAENKGGSKKTSGKGAAYVAPQALTHDGERALSAEEVLDRLYEVAAGDTAPSAYGLRDREDALRLCGGMGEDGERVRGRAEHAFAQRAVKPAPEAPAEEPAAEEEAPAPQPAAPKAKKAKKTAAPPPPPPPVLDMPGDDGEEEPAAEEDGCPNDPDAAAEEPSGGTDPDPAAEGAEEPGDEAPPSSDPGAVIRGGGKKGADGAAPGWRSSPARLIKAALRPLEDKWCDWDALEKAGLKGVKAARSLLKNALEYQERIEAASSKRAAPAAGKVEEGAVVRVKAKHAKGYDGVLDEAERVNLKVTKLAGGTAHCKTNGGAGERVSIPVAHLEVAPAA